MSKLHVNRDRQTLGQFTPEEVADGLAEGRFLPTDLAWREGMDTWQPLSSFRDLPAPSAATTPLIAPGSPTDDIASLPALPSPSWESETGSWMARAVATVREVLGEPTRTFRSMSPAGGMKKPLTFLLLLGTMCSLVSMAYSLTFEIVRPHTETEAMSLQTTIIVYAVVAVLLPLLIAIGSFISAGIFHGCLMLVGATPKSFEATFRIFCYANGATSVLLLLPFCGGLIQAIWNLTVLAIGFREMHGTTTGKAVCAVVLPGLVCCGLGLGLALLVPALTQAIK